ncbi:MAG: SDR family NAD(P)-dependent oxidoreductase [Actinomycetota bacterium]|nr:SDR family oxidoreductase [Actinomycetota bacterium]
MAWAHDRRGARHRQRGFCRAARINVLGLAWLTRLVVPSMIERGSGHIVNIAPNAGMVGVPFNATYSASKHAVVGFSRR